MHHLLYLRDKEKYGNHQEWVMHMGGHAVKCYAIRSKCTNAWCGYVEVGDRKLDTDELDVHGGITRGSDTSIGFDCSHAGDWMPGPDLPVETQPEVIRAMQNLRNSEDHYWTFSEVKAETERLANQIFG